MKEKEQNNFELINLEWELQNLPDETLSEDKKPKEEKPKKVKKKREDVKQDRKKSKKPKLERDDHLSKIEDAEENTKTKNKKEKKKSKRAKLTNKEFARVTYIFVTLFMFLCGYLIHFNIVKSSEIIHSPYNFRQDLMADRVQRGAITDKNGEVLAHSYKADDGTEVREYPYGDLFAHVVGYSAEGKAGLESVRNFDLLTSNAFFLEKIIKEFKGEKNIGDTVRTTLDMELQQAAYNALGNQKGAAVVLEASTGKILAMVSKPTFDPNRVEANWQMLNSDENSALLNRATLGQYAPGSTFKLVTALAYMRQNADYSNYSYNCNGEYTAGDVTIHCYKNQAHGLEGLAESVANSCNSSFSNIGLNLNINEWKSTAEDLLFNKKLPGELGCKGSRFDLSKKDEESVIMMTAIGQGNTMVSPYHMAMITSAIANGGILMKPYLVDQITNYSGVTVKKNMPQKYTELMTSDEAAELVKYMQGVINYGTGTLLSGQGYSVAGKTGTAEVSVDKQKVHSWFVGFSNVENPDIVVSVVVEDADTSVITGTSVAKKIFDAYYY